MKEELKNDKLILKRTQEYLARDQERFREEYAEFKLRTHQSPQKYPTITFSNQVEKAYSRN